MIWTVPDFPLAPSVDVKVRGVKTKTLHPKPLTLNRPKSRISSSANPKVFKPLATRQGAEEGDCEARAPCLQSNKGLLGNLRLYGDSGKENGNYYNGVIVGLGFSVGVMWG